MKVELIPVIKIEYNDHEIIVPDKYPYWTYPEMWDIFNYKRFKKAGFQDDFKPYLPGSSFYRLNDISDKNLTKIIIDHTQNFREGKYQREQANSLNGGYVLKIDGKDKYYPQCCGELSDITYWERISNGQNSYYEGHPTPLIKFENDRIVLDFSVTEFDEPFKPTPPENIISIEIFLLKRAVENVKKELKLFEERIININKDEKLFIKDIGGLLIYDNVNYE